MSASATPDSPATRSGRAKLGLIALLCLTPIVASYLTYYVFAPQTRNNYGALIDPQRSMPALELRELDGSVFDAASLAGKWVLVTVDGAACDARCEEKLYHIRQLRLMTGVGRERIERLWLIEDDAAVGPELLAKYDGTIMLRAKAAQLRAWLPAQTDSAIEDHIFIVDPHQNLMLRFPPHPDPKGTKHDLTHLLAASSIG